MHSLHQLVLRVVLAAQLFPTPGLLAAISRKLSRRVTLAAVRQISRELTRGRPRISTAPVTVKSCLADDPDIDRSRLGFAVDEAGNELSTSEWLEHMRAARVAVSWYWASTAAGKRRRVRCRGLRAFLVTHAPWHSDYLLARPGIHEWWRKTAQDLGAEFRRRTGHQVFGIAVHLGEGCAHLHVICSSVLADNTRVEARGRSGAGRRGFGCLGIAQVAALRRGAAGLEPRRKWLAARVRVAACAMERKAEPLDWTLSQWLDERVMRDFPAAPNPTAPEEFLSGSDVPEDATHDRIRELITLRRELRRKIQQHQSNERKSHG